MLYYNDSVQVGTLNCLKFLSQTFELYPSDENDICSCEAICSMIFGTWRSVKDAFYQKDTKKVEHFYSSQVLSVLHFLEKTTRNGGLLDHNIGLCDILVLTFVYNLFFIKENCVRILDLHSPLLKEHCMGLLLKWGNLRDYFQTRPFHLYI